MTSIARLFSGTAFLLLAWVSPIALSPPVRAMDIPTKKLREFRLHLRDIHRGESLDIVYRRGDAYLPEALTQLNHYLRDPLSGDETVIDVRLFDLLTDLSAATGQPDGIIEVICGYRSPGTNALLRKHSSGVAEHSLHMQGMAIDIRMPGVKISLLHDAALALHRGGVGYYPSSNFVHVDVGQTRTW